MNLVIQYNKKQFIVIRGPSGVGKSLFLRKALNNFIGLNEKLSKNYFIGDEYLFCCGGMDYIKCEIILFILNDFTIHISIMSTTKFCEYRLKHTLLQYFCSFDIFTNEFLLRKLILSLRKVFQHQRF